MKTEEIIIAHLGITQEDYNEIVFHFATAYLYEQGFNDSSMSILQQSPFFWAWWRNQFDRRNQIMINNLLLDVVQPDVEIMQDLRKEFFHIHAPWALSIEINRVVLEESFEKEVVKQIIKSIRNEHLSEVDQ